MIMPTTAAMDEERNGNRRMVIPPAAMTNRETTYWMRHGVRKEDAAGGDNLIGYSDDHANPNANPMELGANSVHFRK